MINTDDFIKRIEIILEYYSLNASTFADKIGVQRSSLSHLLSGRNKPSLDFILKILDVFPEVDLYWILNGKGSFPKKLSLEVIANKNIEEIQSPIQTGSFIQSGDLFSDENYNEQEISKTTNSNNVSNPIAVADEIDKIVIFYKNGTFKSYNPK